MPRSQHVLQSFSRIILLACFLCLSLAGRAYAELEGSACTVRSQVHTMCVNATVTDDVVTYQLTSRIHAPDDVGWFALGFGENMVRTHMVILWQNDDGSTTISQRYAPFYAEPAVVQDPPRLATIAEPVITAWHPKKSTTFAFQIPANPSLLNGTHLNERLIWALSPVRPAKDYLSRLARHFEIGHLVLHFKDTGGDNSAPHLPPALPMPEKDDLDHEGHERTVHAHAFLLSVGFLVLLPFGILAGRWGRTISPLWIQVHRILNMVVAGPVIALGWVLGPVAVYQHGGLHLNDPHKICGAILIFVYVGQFLLGRYIHKRRMEYAVSKAHPPLNILHIAIGLLVIAFAFLQVRSGLDKLQLEADEAPFARWYHKVWAIWAAVVVFLYLAGLALLPRQFRQEQGTATTGHSDYVPLADHGHSESSSTRLLFETPDFDEDDSSDTTRKKGNATKDS